MLAKNATVRAPRVSNVVEVKGMISRAAVPQEDRLGVPLVAIVNADRVREKEPMLEVLATDFVVLSNCN
jgi:hypothetical protein